MPDAHQTARRFLLDAYAAGLKAVDPRRTVREALLADMPAARRIHLLAVGKAAAGMHAGALDALGERVKHSLLVMPDDNAPVSAAAEVLLTAHPLPDERSLAAGRRACAALASTDCELVLLLVSGGASALLDIPAAPLLDEELLDIHRELYGMGLDIREWNAVRQRLSALKAGGLLDVLPAGVDCKQLLISDVPGDDPAIIASGLGAPLQEPPALPELPANIIALLPPWKPRRHAGIETEIVASNAMLLAAMEAFARERHVPVRICGDLSGDAAAMARRCVAELLDGQAGLYLWGGETTVQLPATPPPGGRNQHLALAAAIELAGRDDIFLLAAGTDGRDGNTEDAGGLVDGSSLKRGAVEQLDASNCLAGFRSHEFLAASGDLVYTGSSGTNVMDVVLGLRN